MTTSICPHADGTSAEHDGGPSLHIGHDAAFSSASAAAPELEGAQKTAERLRHTLALPCSTRSALIAPDAEHIVAGVGCALLVLHVPSGAQRYLPACAGASTGALALHPSSCWLAVGENRNTGGTPRIIVYAWPSLELVISFSGGTQVAYAALDFSHAAATGSRRTTAQDGGSGGGADAEASRSSEDLLASLGGAPDYLLTLWDWRSGTEVMRCKAFSQEVTGLRWAASLPGVLTTYGMGHIRFWRMAATFTGLKLQGDLGRWGALELADVSGAADLGASGRVVSVTEAGDLVVWEGGLVRSVVMRPDGLSAHEGPIHLLHLDTARGCLVTGGVDGRLRVWPLEGVARAEPPEGSLHAEVAPLAQVVLPGGMQPRALAASPGGATWFVQGGDGAVLQVPWQEGNAIGPAAHDTPKHLLGVSGGPLVGLAALPGSSVAVAACADGSIRAFDYRQCRLLHSRRFSAPVSCMALLPCNDDIVGSSTALPVALGFLDGTVRCVHLCSDGWRLVAALKPHAAPVAALAAAPGGTCLVSVASDGTLFLFDVLGGATKLRPQLSGGLTELLKGGAPTCASWGIAPDSSAHCVLIGASNGVVVEVQLLPNTSREQLEGGMVFHQRLSGRSYTLCTPQAASSSTSHCSAVSAETTTSRGGCEAAGAGSSSTADAPAVAALSDQQRQDQQGQHPVSGGTAVGAVVASISWVGQASGHGSEGRFWVAAAGPDHAGGCWECCWGMAQPLRRLCSGAGGVTCVSIQPCLHTADGHQGQMVLLGTSAGQVQLQAIAPASTHTLWQGALHDCSRGRVTALALSSDGNEGCLISGAADGALLLLVSPLQGPDQPPPPAARLPSMAAEAPVPEAEDITNPSALTLEAAAAQQRQQQAETAAAAACERMREHVAQLRDHFSTLLAENAAAPAAARLPRSAFDDVDGGRLDALVEAERAAACDAVRRSVAWRLETARLALSKLRTHFTDGVEEERFELLPFGAGAAGVASFRVERLPPDLQRDLDLCLNGDDGDSAATPRPVAASGHHSPRQLAHSRSRNKSRGVLLQEQPSQQPAPSTSPSKADAARAARAARVAEWTAFLGSRPDLAALHPSDAAALAAAEASVGDYCLRSDLATPLSEAERMNPAKKRREMLVLLGRMAELRAGFNSALHALRAHKVQLMVHLGADSVRVAKIHTALGLQPDAPPQAQLHPREDPTAARERVTQQDLEANDAHRAAARQRDARPAAGGAFAGGFTAGDSALAAAGVCAAGAGMATSSGHPGVATCAGVAAPSAPAPTLSSPLTPLEEADAAAAKQQLQTERHALLAKRTQETTEFDASLSRLGARRLEVAYALTLGRLRLLEAAAELALLRDMAGREAALAAQREARAAERGQLAAADAELEAALAEREAEGAAAAAARAGVVATFEALVSPHEAFKGPLERAFLRKVKRPRRAAGSVAASTAASVAATGHSGSDGGASATDVGTEASGFDDETDEDDSEDEGGDHWLDEGDDGEEVAPPGCEAALFERVVALRERRADAEAAAADAAKGADALRRERELLARRARGAEASLATVMEEAAAFEREKRAALNALPVDVLLPASRVAFLDGNGSLPSDVSGALVFGAGTLARLRRRSQELDQERVALKVAAAELRDAQARLQAEHVTKVARLGVLRERCAAVQVLKFGHEVPRTLLERMADDAMGAGRGAPAAEALRAALKEQEAVQARERASTRARLAAEQAELLQATRANTLRLERVNGLTRQQRALQAGLVTAAGRAGTAQDTLDARVRQDAERSALVVAIQRNEVELAQLRQAVAALHSKGPLAVDGG